MPNNIFYDKFSKMTDEKFLELLTSSINEPFFEKTRLPGFPQDEIQKNFVGSSGEATLREAFHFYSIVKTYVAKHSFLHSDTKILDFGCGWGRMARFFLKDVKAENLYGVDVDSDIIDTCNKIMHYGNYLAVEPFPPTTFQDNSFDVIYAYSVFSHLSEGAHIKWVSEFKRILKPDGLLLVTTQGRSFLDFCASCRPKLTFLDKIKDVVGLYQPQYETLWHKALSKSFVNTESSKKDYDKGKFLFSPTGGGPYRPSTFYGEAIIPRQYVENEWTKYLRFIDFVDDRSFMPQALIVMQKD